MMRIKSHDFGSTVAASQVVPNELGSVAEVTFLEGL